MGTKVDIFVGVSISSISMSGYADCNVFALQSKISFVESKSDPAIEGQQLQNVVHNDYDQRCAGKRYFENLWQHSVLYICRSKYM